MTGPDELRKTLRELEHPIGAADLEKLFASAAAWDAERASWWRAVGEYRAAMSKALEDEKALRKRLEAAEKAEAEYARLWHRDAADNSALRKRPGEAQEEALRYIVAYFDNDGLKVGCVGAERVWPAHLMERIAKGHAALAGEKP
jgi:hypothetical protein